MKYLKNISLKNIISNLWYPFTVALSDVTVFIAINLSFLSLYFFLLFGENQNDSKQKENLQIANVYLELGGLSNNFK